jgi:hypothetical protein
VAWAYRSRRGSGSGLGFGLRWETPAWWWLIQWLGLRWVWLFADLDVVVWACATEIGLVWWLGLGLGFRCTAWWWLTAWAWAWVHRVVVGFSGFCRLGFGAWRGGWAWVDGVVVGRVWVFGGGAVGLGLEVVEPCRIWVFFSF